jgi:hypothetical protein
MRIDRHLHSRHSKTCSGDVDMRLKLTFAAFLSVASGATAVEAPKVPPAAKKLSGPQIEALYRDATVVGMNFDQRDLITFTATITSATRRFTVHVFSANRHVGSAEVGYRIEGDLWCYKPVNGGTETCVTVHLDGEVIYEVRPDGRLSARNLAWR